MKVNLQELILWVLLPFLNFIIWFYLAHTGSFFHTVDCPVTPVATSSLQTLLDQSQQELIVQALAAGVVIDPNQSPLNGKKKCPKKLKKSSSLRGKETTSTTASVQQVASSGVGQCHPISVKEKTGRQYVTFEDTMEFEKYRAERLASMTVEILLKTYTDDHTTILHRDDSDEDQIGTCETVDHHMIGMQQENCLAVVYSQDTKHTHNLLRVDQDIDIYGLSISNPDPSQIDKYSVKFALNQYNEGKLWPAGFFRKVPKERGRERTKDKLGTFLTYYHEITEQFEVKMKSHNIQKGDDITVMVLNEGELDLFLNFACSCKLHNIPLSNVLVFAGSPEVITMVEATGAMALYHVGYAAVSKKASVDYLDRVFVDMMWYKAFSVYLVLSHGINVLFQDVDLVWFREPMGYFHKYIADNQDKFTRQKTPVEAFFSDDGQRSRRYTPFYANSGFYYLLSSERSIYFTWSIMVAMDAIQVLGSHQNVFTTRLLETVSLTTTHTKILPLEDFPTGIMYHHHQGYMKRLKQKKVDPYNFHM